MGKSVENGEKSHSAEESIVKGVRWPFFKMVGTEKNLC